VSIAEVKQKAVPVLKRHRALRAAVFGSAARGEDTDSSDLDMLVELEEDVGLLEFIGLKQELEEVLGRPVDLVEYDALKPRVRERVLAEQVAIL
jgi:hypothetical protein